MLVSILAQAISCSNLALFVRARKVVWFVFVSRKTTHNVSQEMAVNGRVFRVGANLARSAPPISSVAKSKMCKRHPHAPVGIRVSKSCQAGCIFQGGPCSGSHRQFGRGRSRGHRCSRLSNAPSNRLFFHLSINMSPIVFSSSSVRRSGSSVPKHAKEAVKEQRLREGEFAVAEQRLVDLQEAARAVDVLSIAHRTHAETAQPTVQQDPLPEWAWETRGCAPRWPDSKQVDLSGIRSKQPEMCVRRQRNAALDSWTTCPSTNRI